MIQVPLRYSERIFGYAKIDDDTEPLRDLGYYSVTLPRSLRQVASKRPDIILAFLQEDPSTICKCTPFISLFGTQILLVHMVIRGELARMITTTQTHMHGSLLNQHLRSEINQIRGSIGRVVYANGDRTDCRRENLREL